MDNSKHTQSPLTTSSNVNAHYNGRDLLDLLVKHNVPFSEGNIMKYVFRWKDKGGVADLIKAKDYLDTLINYYKDKNGH